MYLGEMRQYGVKMIVFFNGIPFETYIENKQCITFKNYKYDNGKILSPGSCYPPC